MTLLHKQIKVIKGQDKTEAAGKVLLCIYFNKNTCLQKNSHETTGVLYRHIFSSQWACRPEGMSIILEQFMPRTMIISHFKDLNVNLRLIVKRYLTELWLFLVNEIIDLMYMFSIIQLIKEMQVTWACLKRQVIVFLDVM